MGVSSQGRGGLSKSWWETKVVVAV